MPARLEKPKKQEEFGGPNKVSTAMFQYQATVRPKLMAEMKKKNEKEGRPFKVTEMGSLLSKKWAELDAKKKKVFEDKYVQQKEVYNKDFAAWKETPAYQEYLAAMEAHKTAKKVAKTKAATKVDKPDSMPVKPMNAYFTFCNSKREKVTADLKKAGKQPDVKATASKFKEMWDALTEEKRKSLGAEATAALDAYKTELTAWKETEDGKAYYTKLEEGAAAVKAAKEGPARKKKKGEDGEAEAVEEEEAGDEEEEEEEEEEEASTEAASSAAA